MPRQHRTSLDRARDAGTLDDARTQERAGSRIEWIANSLRPPKSTLQKLRWFFLVTSALGGALVLPLLLFVATSPVPHRLLAVCALCFVLVLRWGEYRTGQVGAFVCDPLEGAALFLFATALRTPFEALPIFFFNLHARSLHAAGRRIVTGWAAYALALAGTLYVGGSERYKPDAADLVGLLFGFGITSANMFVLRMSLSKHERALRRERTLADACAEFVSGAEVETIRRTAIEAALRLVREAEGGRASIARRAAAGAPGEMIVAASVGDGSDDALGKRFAYDEHDAAAHGAPHHTEAARVGEPRDPTSAPDGRFVFKSGGRFVRSLARRAASPEGSDVLIVDADVPLPAECEGALCALAAQAALALETATLTRDLRTREARFRSLVQNSSDIVTLVDADGTITHQTASARVRLGCDPGAFIGRRFADLAHPHDRKKIETLLADARTGACPPVEWRIKQHHGSYLHVETIANDLLADPNVGSVVLNTRDVSERKRLEEQLTHQAFHDSLSDLPNRALFMDRLQRALDRAERAGSIVAVLFIDLDNFKYVNDTFGHCAGDDLLVQVTSRLRECIRETDTAARLGGDEFTILIENVSGAHEATLVAERIRARLDEPFALDGREVFTSASIGIAFTAPDRYKPADLLRDADVAMYRAKSSGKARYEIHSGDMNRATAQRLELEADLRRAIERSEFEVFYQPVIDFATDRISEVEALVRWRHPKRGLVPPMEFIPLAEENGMILPIGDQVLNEACRQVREWQTERPQAQPLVVSVNISARQFAYPKLAETVARTLWRTQLDPAHLKLEITESVTMQDAEQTACTLAELKRLGVQLAIDDFGTGYSSLSYLKRFPLDILKIDRTFVERLGHDSQDAAIVTAIIQLAKALDLAVVGEGIETVEQLTRLRELGCDSGQGYYFARPLARDQMSELLVRAGDAVSGGAEARLVG